MGDSGKWVLNSSNSDISLNEFVADLPLHNCFSFHLVVFMNLLSKHQAGRSNMNWSMMWFILFTQLLRGFIF